MAQQISPDWTRYNAVMNEGGDGYNPHAKYIAKATIAVAQPRRMVAGKMRTQAEATTFAKNCMSGEQRKAFEAEVARVFGA